MNPLDQINTRRALVLVKSYIEDTISTNEEDSEGNLYNEAINWFSIDDYRKEITQRLDYLVDKKAILKYDIDSISLDEYGMPVGEILICPMATVDYVTLKISHENEEITEN